MGAKAAESLIRMIEQKDRSGQPERIMIAGKLLEGQSVGKPADREESALTGGSV